MISSSQVSPLAASTQSIALDGSSQNRLMTMPEKKQQELSSSFPLTGNTNESKSITKLDVTIDIDDLLFFPTFIEI
jgi:hypothetical protein